MPLPPPDTPDCAVVELRQYTLHPGQRDTLIDLFDHEFVETQEAVGIRVIGQFRDLDGPDRFVWLRGFADMAARGAALPAFYGGPVWAAHRDAANTTMVDSDDVLLLRPAWPGSTLPAGERAAQPAGLLVARVLHLNAAADDALLALCRGTLSAACTGARWQAWYATERAANNFPRLPVRDEPVLVHLALFNGEADVPPFADTPLQRWLARPTQTLRLTPTRRSALHA